MRFLSERRKNNEDLRDKKLEKRQELRDFIKEKGLLITRTLMMRIQTRRKSKLKWNMLILKMK